MSELITRDLALKLVLEQPFDYGSEVVELTAARGRILAEPLVADRDQPPFNRVAMDGIAINYATYATGQRFFARARVQGAGEEPSPLTDPEQCVEIMTGAALPVGCTAVIRYEDLRWENDGYHVPDGVADGQNIHPRGKDTAEGAELAPAGSRITIPTLAMLATFGYAQVRVQTRPSIAVITTGDELVPVNATPTDYQIRRSNAYQLIGLLESQGYTASGHHLPDDKRLLREQLEVLLQEHDVIMLSGGVSKGKFDYLPEVLAELGVNKLLHGVAQRPGKPLWVGRTETCMVFGLPGNPQSSLSCCLAYVLPFLTQQLGTTSPFTYAELTVDVPFKPNLTLFSFVALRSDEATGKLLATPVRHAGSGDASALLRGGGFLELPAGKELYRAGEIYRVNLL